MPCCYMKAKLQYAWEAELLYNNFAMCHVHKCWPLVTTLALVSAMLACIGQEGWYIAAQDIMQRVIPGNTANGAKHVAGSPWHP